MNNQRYATALYEMGVPRDTIRAFFKWMYDNLNVWRAFEAEALNQWNLGQRHWGAKACAERIRYNEAGILVAGAPKVPNQWIAYLSRVFAIKHPDKADLFVYKEIKGVKQAA